jgi:hypothetical protein
MVAAVAVVRRSSLAGDRQAGKRTLPGAPIVVSWLVCVTARHEKLIRHTPHPHTHTPTHDAFAAPYVRAYICYGAHASVLATTPVPAQEY